MAYRRVGPVALRDTMTGAMLIAEPSPGPHPSSPPRQGKEDVSTMWLKHRVITWTFAAAALASPVAMMGCASGGYYDTGYADTGYWDNGVYFRWNADEDRRYRRWERGSHLQHMDFNRRSPEQRRAYMGSRHR